MTGCCNDKADEIEALRSRQGNTLKIVLGINVVMFIIEFTAGLLANSVALIADSMDMLGDALVYGFSLYVVTRSPKMKAISALFKGAIMALFGFFVLGQVIYKIAVPQMPVFEIIGIIGLLVLITNGICLALLWKHRAEDINMSSVWLCSCNDIIANISVLFAALGVWLFNSSWPDILIGLALAVLFFRSALFVLHSAIIELQTSENR